VWERWEIHTVFLLESLKGRDSLEDLGVDGNIRMDLREIGWEGAV
jgi:hypothetical protein